jgi:hypothetical protein
MRDQWVGLVAYACAVPRGRYAVACHFTALTALILFLPIGEAGATIDGNGTSEITHVAITTAGSATSGGSLLESGAALMNNGNSINIQDNHRIRFFYDFPGHFR